MEKIYLYESELGKLRYFLINNEVFMVFKDVSSALGFDTTFANAYVKTEDTMVVPYTNTIGKSDEIQAINIYSVCSFISFGMMKANNELATKFKDIVFKGLIPKVILSSKPEISKEDEAILGIIHANSDTERANEIYKFKNAILNNKPAVTHKRRSKKSIDCVSITDATKCLNLKHGQISNYFLSKGMIYYSGEKNTSVHVKPEASSYLIVFDDGSSRRKLGITPDGIDYIETNIESVRAVSSRVRKVI